MQDADVESILSRSNDTVPWCRQCQDRRGTVSVYGEEGVLCWDCVDENLETTEWPYCPCEGGGCAVDMDRAHHHEDGYALCPDCAQ